MNYNYNQNTLFHSINFNLVKFESILKNGILSKKEAEELNSLYELLGLPLIPYAKNYEGSNKNEYISMVAYELINEEDPTSAYSLYTQQGISFIIENTKFLIDKTKYNIHRQDEVWVEKIIPKENIKGIIIPQEYQDKLLNELTYLSLISSKYENIYSNYQLIRDYLKEYNYTIDEETSKKYLNQIKLLSLFIQTTDIKNEPKEYMENNRYFKELLIEFNSFIAYHISNCFKNIYNQDLTIKELIEKLIEKNNAELNIYALPTDKIKTPLK